MIAIYASDGNQITSRNLLWDKGGIHPPHIFDRNDAEIMFDDYDVIVFADRDGYILRTADGEQFAVGYTEVS